MAKGKWWVRADLRFKIKIKIKVKIKKASSQFTLN
jgi:hypothetical protein